MQLVPIEDAGSVAITAEDRSGTVAAVVEQVAALYGRRGFEMPWICYLAVEQGAWVGTCGFAGPALHDEVEIAYFTFPDFEGQGVATRMVTALLALTGSTASLRGLRFIAHTLPQEGASTSILRKAGFSCLGPVLHAEDGTVWKWVRDA